MLCKICVKHIRFTGFWVGTCAGLSGRIDGYPVHVRRGLIFPNTLIRPDCLINFSTRGCESSTLRIQGLPLRSPSRSSSCVGVVEKGSVDVSAWVHMRYYTSTMEDVTFSSEACCVPLLGSLLARAYEGGIRGFILKPTLSHLGAELMPALKARTTMRIPYNI